MSVMIYVVFGYILMVVGVICIIEIFFVFRDKVGVLEDGI